MNNKNKFAGFCFYFLPFIVAYFFTVYVYEPAISKQSTEQISWIECKINDRCKSVDDWNFLANDINEGFAFVKHFDSKNPSFPWFLIVSDHSVDVYTKKEIFENGKKMIIPSFLVKRFECSKTLIPCLKTTIEKLKTDY